MPHLHKQKALMVCCVINGGFSEKIISQRIPVISNKQHSRSQTPQKDKTLAHGNTCFCESKSQFQAIQVRSISHRELVKTQPMPRKETALSSPLG